MFPTLDIFGRTIGVYGLCAALGFLAMLLCVALLARRRGMVPEEEVVVALVSAAGAAVGAVLLYGITNIPTLVSVFEAYGRGSYGGFGLFAADVVRCFGGFVFYGGLIGALGACCLYSRRRGYDILEQLDLFAVAVPLFHVFGRIGCFMGGCCYGVEADWGPVFTDSPVWLANGVHRVPIQLFEAAGNACIFVAMLALFLKGRLRGKLIAVYGISYGTLRFVDEFWRGDVYRGIWGPLSTSQWISLGLVAASAVLLVMLRRRRCVPIEPQTGISDT